jgi:hypothetical protein
LTIVMDYCVLNYWSLVKKYNYPSSMYIIEDGFYYA